MILSISIAFCDKDVKYLNNCLKQITEKVHINYEVILVDNRDNQQDHIDVPPFCKYVTKGKNTYCFEGRRQGLQVASGDFIWFFDVDDSIDEHIMQSDIEGLDTSYDLIQFYYKTNPPNKEFEYYNPITRPVYNPRVIPRTMSCRWFNVQTLKKKLSPVKEDIVLMNGEDNFIVDLITATGPYKYKILPKYYYIYNIGIAQHLNIIEKNSVESLEFVLKGCDNLKYLYSFISPFRYAPVITQINKFKQKYKELTGNDYIDKYDTTSHLVDDNLHRL